jgi:hypothetical protein
MKICEPGTPTTRQHFTIPDEYFRGKDLRRGKRQGRDEPRAEESGAGVYGSVAASGIFGRNESP